MNRASLLGLTLALPALGATFFACQKEDPRPPASDGPGVFNPFGGSGSGAEGGGAEDAGTIAEIATFPGFVPSGLAMDNDIAIVTLDSLSAGQPGEIVQVEADGKITVLISDAVVPTLPVFGTTQLFYIDTLSGSTQSLMKLDFENVSAGEQTVLSGIDQPSGLAISGNDLLIASNAGGTGVEIDTVPVALGTTSSPVTSIAGAYSPAGIAADPGFVYFVAAAPGAGQILKATKTGGPADAIVTGSPGSLGPLCVASGKVLYTITDNPNGALLATTTGGGPSTTIVSGLINPSALAAADGYVYFTDNDTNGSISRILLDDDAAAPETILTATNPSALAVGTKAVYAITANGLVRIPR